MALALFLAVAAAAAGYAGLIACSRDAEPPTAERPVLGDPPAAPSAVQDLAPMSLPPRAAPAAYRAERATGVATVQLVGVDAESRSGSVAVLDGRSGVVLGWRALDGGGALAASLTFEGIPEGNHWVVLALKPWEARFGYVTRAPLQMTLDGEDVRGTASLDVAVRDVTIQVTWAPDEPECHLVLPLLRRTDDPAWRLPPDRHEPTTSGTIMELRDLGAGTYALELDGAEVEAADRPHLQFEVPGTDAIALRCRRK